MKNPLMTAMLCATLAGCMAVQERPEGFSDAAFQTWQERCPGVHFESYTVTTQGDGSATTYMLSGEEQEGMRYLVMREDGTVVEDRYTRELDKDELPEAVALTIAREYPTGSVGESLLIVRNDTTEYLVNVDLEDDEELPQYRFYDTLVLTANGSIKNRTNTATTDGM